MGSIIGFKKGGGSNMLFFYLWDLQPSNWKDIYIYPPFQPCLTWMRMNRKLPKRVNRPTNKFQLNHSCHGRFVPRESVTQIQGLMMTATCFGPVRVQASSWPGMRMGWMKLSRNSWKFFWGENYRDVVVVKFGEIAGVLDHLSPLFEINLIEQRFSFVIFLNWVLWSALFTSGMLGSAIVSSDGGNDIMCQGMPGFSPDFSTWFQWLKIQRASMEA